MRTLVLTGLALLALAAPAVAADPSWRLEQPAPPAGAPFKVPLGAPGDLQFWNASRGLLAVEGNAVTPRGLMIWNGERWRTLSVVCGGSADTLRVAWAGPTEFWTISEPSKPRVGSGTTLCHYKDGQVVGSYGTLTQSADPYRLMTAATCRTASDCWFGGPASSDPAGARVGAFRLHWDGTGLTTSYGPQGRGISDLEAHDGTIFESAYAGPRAEDRSQAINRVSEPVPALLRRINAAGTVSLDPFVPQPLAGVPDDGSELLALDSDGSQLWAGGGGAASGPAAPVDGAVARPPLLTRLGPGEGTPREITPVAAAGVLGATERVADLAALPETDDAMLALQPFAERRSTNAKARVGRIDATTGQLDVVRLPASGAGRGSAARIACPATGQCWMATTAGWLFHYSDGSALPVDTEPTLQGLITDRPNESAAQFVPDTPPTDDSLLLAPPPVEVATASAPTETTKTLAPLLKNVRSKLHGLTLELSFRLTRRAKVAIVAKRGGKVVARTKQRWLKPGKRTLTLRLSRKRWPTKLAFSVTDPAAPKQSAASDDDDVVTTGSVPFPIMNATAFR